MKENNSDDVNIEPPQQGESKIKTLYDREMVVNKTNESFKVFKVISIHACAGAWHFVIQNHVNL